MQKVSNYDQLAALNLIPAASWVFDLDHHRIWWGNQAAIEFWQADDLADLKSRDFSSDTDMVRQRLRDSFNNTPEGSFASESWTLYPKGHPTNALLHLSPLLIEEGRAAVLIHLIVMPQDKAGDPDPNAQRLLEAARYSQTIVRTYSKEGRLLSQNPAAASVFPALPSMSADITIRAMFEDPETGDRILEDVSQGISGWFEEIVITASGKRWYRLNAQPAFDPVTGLPSIIVSGEDTTESRSIVDRLAAMNESLERRVEERTTELRDALTLAMLARAEAEQANNAKSSFLAQMSHDLRTPLNAIMGMSDLMRSEIFGPIGDRYKAYNEDVLNAATHLLDLINDLLDLSKIEAGALEPVFEWCDIKNIITEACDIARRGSGGQCPEITVQIDGDPEIYSDRRMIFQILVNLLSNAVRFTPEAGQIYVAAITRNGVTLLRVRDTGAGIPADKLKDVLTPYRQGDPNLAAQNQGTGLGLAIVNSLSGLLGGSTRIESTVGQGTEVIVTLHHSKVS